MKKVFSFVLIACLGLSANAQQKKFRAGLVTGTTVSWLKVQTKKIERNGVGNGFTIGMAADYRINNNISVSSGVQFDLESFKINYGSTTNTDLSQVYYGFNDTEIYKYKNGFVADYTDSAAFELSTRNFKGKYITIPIFLKFQTNMIGAFSYYGKFGIRSSFLAGVRMNDEGYLAKYDANTGFFSSDSEKLSEMNNMKPEAVKKGLSAVRLGLGVYGGAEWNFTGNTFLFAEFGFNYGVSPIVYQKSEHLVEKVNSGSSSTFENLNVKSNPQHMFELKFGLLF